jgi:TolA-binding protein
VTRSLPWALAVLVVVLGRGASASPLDDAEKAWADGDREAAGRLVRAWTSAEPDAKRQPRVTALLARTAEDPTEAAGLWDELLALDPPADLATEAHWMKAMHAYSAGLYVAAEHEFDVLAHDFAQRFPRGRALLWKGLSELAADDPDTALENLQQASREADGDDATSVEFALAHVQFRTGKIADALRLYERFERDHRKDGRASAAARRTVECLRLLGRETEASARAARIERDYPSSVEATLAREAVRSQRGGMPAPSSQGPQRFVVQVAALTDPANAARLAQQVRQLSLGNVRVEKTEGPEGTVQRVIVGPFDDEDKAHAACDSIATLGDLSPRVRAETAR